MHRLFTKASIALVMLITVGVVVFGKVSHTFAMGGSVDSLASHSPAIVATAATPPNVAPAVLNGKPVYVLSMTQAGDTVLVRCYPGYEPSLTVRMMGGNSGQREGVLVCSSSS